MVCVKGKKRKQMDKFHFIAIGGIGQSALAKILLQKGYSVTGSDIADSKYTKELKDLGAKIYIGHSADNVPNDAKIVASTAIKEDNPEMVRARELGLTIYHRSDILQIVSKHFKNFIGFSGTHGKTTTSGLCAYVLEEMGIKPSYAIGGIIPKYKTNGSATDSDIFVAELDESDGTIVKYAPHITVINNLEPDHCDFYGTGLEKIFETFKTFTNNLASDDIIILNADNSGAVEFSKELNNFVTFGIEKSAKYMACDIKLNGIRSEFTVVKDGMVQGNIKLSIPGLHNVYNALAVISALFEAGFEFLDMQNHFEGFSGMGRRFQLVKEFDGIQIIDDYAHHPSEIKATLSASRNIHKGRIVAIFQPHRYTRFKGLWGDFLSSFDDADIVFVTDVWRAGDEPIEGFDSSDFAEQLGARCTHLKGSMAEISAEIAKFIKPDDMVLTLGAGDITNIGKFIYENYTA